MNKDKIMTTQQNKKIAAFIGAKLKAVDYYAFPKWTEIKNYRHIKTFQFDTSWEWLMPLYFKCNNVLSELIAENKDAILKRYGASTPKKYNPHPLMVVAQTRIFDFAKISFTKKEMLDFCLNVIKVSQKYGKTVTK